MTEPQWESGSQNLFDRTTGVYSGPAANSVWTSLCGGSSVPIQTTRLDGRSFQQFGPDGSIFGHWDEECTGLELMSPALTGRSQNPLSELTVAGLEDIGWVVDYSGAQPYVPSPSAACKVTCQARRGRNLRAVHRGRSDSTQSDRDLFLDGFFQDATDRLGDFFDDLDDFADDVSDILQDVTDRILPILTDQQIRMAARSAFEGMLKVREEAPILIEADDLQVVMGDVMTVLMFDDEMNVRDLTFKWDDVKDMFADE